MIGGQRIQVGLPHAGKTVAVTVEAGTYQITVEDGIAFAAPRTTSRDIKRYKASNYPAAGDRAMSPMAAIVSPWQMARQPGRSTARPWQRWGRALPLAGSSTSNRCRSRRGRGPPGSSSSSAGSSRPATLTPSAGTERNSPSTSGEAPSQQWR